MRKNSEWMETLEEAFDAHDVRVQKGKEAEDLYESWATKKYQEVINYSKERTEQNAGVDFSFYKAGWKRPYTVDIKGNATKRHITLDNREDGWLRNPNKTSDRICHVDVKHGWATDYRRYEMIEHLDKYDVPKIENLRICIFDDEFKGILHRYNLKEENAGDFIRKRKAEMQKPDDGD